MFVKEIGREQWWLPLTSMGSTGVLSVMVFPTSEKRGGKEEIWRLDCGEFDDFNGKLQTIWCSDLGNWEAVPWRFLAPTEV